MLAAGLTCAYDGCDEPMAEPDHYPPLALHTHVEGSGCCVLVPSCAPHQRRQAVDLANGKPPLVPYVPAPGEALEVPDVVGFTADDEVWDVDWLDDLRDVPDDATWPSLMSAPHPRATGSYGAEFEVFVLTRGKRSSRLRWWQRLLARRLLEHDADGRLVWEEAILTLARQLGKTWVVGALCDWRLHRSDLFGAEQLIVSTGKDLSVVREMQRPYRAMAKGDAERYKVREVNGQEEIERLQGDGSRWMLRSKFAVYGLSACFATLDEAWKIRQAVVDDGLGPTMVSQDQSQLLLLSTAHRMATRLMLERRAVACAQLDDPTDDTLIVEWSAPRDCELDDRAAWRAASPHWDAKREKHIARVLVRAQAGIPDPDDPDEPDPIESFRAQWLNIWPARTVPIDATERLIAEERWLRGGADLDMAGQVWLGVEDWYGKGVGTVAVARSVDGTLVCGGRCWDRREDGFDWVTQMAGLFGEPVLTVGPTLAEAVELAGQPFAVGRPMDLARGMALLRALADKGAVVHDGSEDLVRQIAHAKVSNGPAGLTLLRDGARADLVRALLWALVTTQTRVLQAQVW